MDTYLISKEQIEALPGTDKTHFLNPRAKRLNKSLGDLTGLNQIGFHIIEIQAGDYSTEPHLHYFEEECVYILEGEATALIGEETLAVKAGDFLGYRAGGKAHGLKNTGTGVLKCIVVGQRLDNDVADYPQQQKRIFRNKGLAWDLVNTADISHPEGGKK